MRFIVGIVCVHKLLSIFFFIVAVASRSFFFGVLQKKRSEKSNIFDNCIIETIASHLLPFFVLVQLLCIKNEDDLMRERANIEGGTFGLCFCFQPNFGFHSNIIPKLISANQVD